ncbi:MAG: VOC family protein [Gammaproteobacteria bacterium]
MSRPKPMAGLRHVALTVRNLEACEHFYVELLGMRIDWRPDADNLYLTSGNDNLALHRAPADFNPGTHQRLDHIGFIIDELDEVDVWHEFLRGAGVSIKTAPQTHRDKARSFYCEDPDGNTVQLIFHPLLAAK